MNQEKEIKVDERGENVASVFFKNDALTIYKGSNLDVLPLLEDNSVDSIVTDPSIWIGVYG